MKNHYKNGITLTSARDIASITRTIFAQTKTNILNFIRLYPDGRVNYLCDNVDWMKHYFEAQFPSIGAFEQDTQFQKRTYTLWHALSNIDPIVIASRTRFNIRYGITFTQAHQNYCDFFNFGTSETESNAHERLISAIPFFEQFIRYFYETFTTLLPKLDEAAFSLHDFKPNEFTVSAPPYLYLGPDFSYQYLTPQEISCAKALIRGFSYHETAQMMAISFRTVEKHVEHLKQKLQCANLCELGYRLAQIRIGEE